MSTRTESTAFTAPEVSKRRYDAFKADIYSVSAPDLAFLTTEYINKGVLTLKESIEVNAARRLACNEMPQSTINASLI